MPNWIIVAVGGIAGTLGRYWLAAAVHRLCGTGFPYGTLAVNGLGCLVMGFLAALAERKFLLSPQTRLLLMVGLLGAFTTFSSLVYESWRLMQDGQWVLAGANLLGSLFLGLLAFWAGSVAASLL